MRESTVFSEPNQQSPIFGGIARGIALRIGLSALNSRLLEEAVEPELLVIVKYHDEPYALWQQVKRRGTCDPAGSAPAGAHPRMGSLSRVPHH